MIIQARVGSTRLRGKVLEPISGEPMLAHVVARSRAIRGVDEAVVATTDRPDDDAIVALCEGHGWPVFRGSEPDVLDRYYQAALAAGAKHVVRVTSDCPLVCPHQGARVVETHLETGADYTHNITLGGSGMPLGTGLEIFAIGALEASWREATEPDDREHVDEYVLARPERFRIERVEPPPPLRHPELRLTVDTADDLELIRSIYDQLYQPPKLLELSAVVRLVTESEPSAEAMGR